MKSFVDIGLLLNKNSLLRKNLQKTHVVYKEQAEFIKQKFSNEALIFEKLRSFVSDKKIDSKKLLDHIADMEMQYTNFLQVKLVP